MLLQRATGIGPALAVCQCGHLEIQHGSRLSKISNDKYLRESHHGSCCCKQCECSRFTFERMATVNEIADIMLRENAA